ncbi:unnamed protein product [Didymodactylos carnosus]|uniref:Uncharacterized protein n=1 Tax=Didymodactylos carnosus TaxID=1234261 RepID=A0A815D7J0_9BILA|nr:unnamed protein product [Didymodactylos carnosus]CAF4094768.1 unnamed protein product [Didymodactylos carnosus]
MILLNIRSHIETIVRRNIEYLTKHQFLFPGADIPAAIYYQTNNNQHQNKLTLCLHVDGAPLVRTSKQSLWPCFASIVELPQFLREQQKNLIVLALWSAREKPNVSIYLHKLVIDISNLMEDGNYSTEFSQVLYPYAQYQFVPRTHQQFLATAEQAAIINHDGRRHEITIDGVKGLSKLLEIIEYPTQVIYDYMHLVCLGTTMNLIKRWQKLIEKNNVTIIDQKLHSVRLPHNLNTPFIHSITSPNDWKAKNFRTFVLYIGLPIIISYLPILHASHFASYCIVIRILHCPIDSNEIQFAEDLIHYFCRTAASVYDQGLELYSVHCHLHLPSQVRQHGGLAFCSAFCFESAIRSVPNKDALPSSVTTVTPVNNQSKNQATASKAQGTAATSSVNRLAGKTVLSPEALNEQILKKIVHSSIQLAMTEFSNDTQKKLNQIVTTQKKHDTMFQLLFKNQVKIQKTFSHRNIHIPLEQPEGEPEQEGQETSEEKFETAVFCERGGEQINLLTLEADSNYMNLYVTMMMDVVYANAEEIIHLETFGIQQNKEAVRSRFKLNKKKFDQVWPRLHDVFLQKRRNLSKAYNNQPSTPSPIRRQVMRSRFRRSGLNIESLYASTKTTTAYSIKEEEANSYESNELREEEH